jgi:hypothetical protein
VQLNETSLMMSRTRIAITPGRPPPNQRLSRDPGAARRANGWAERGRLSSVAGPAVPNAHGDYRGTIDGSDRRRQHRYYGGAPMASPADASTAAIRLPKEILRVMAQDSSTPLLGNP